MRRIFDPCGGVAKHDVFAATDCYVESEEEGPSYEARAAYREAKEARQASPRKSRSKSNGANEVNGDGQVLNRLNSRTGERNRRYTCGSEYHLAPRRPQRRKCALSVDSAPSA